MQKRLEFVKGSSAKFWEVSQSGATLSVTFGRIGTDGQTQYRSFDSPKAAQADAEKQAAAKLKKGYREVGVRGPRSAAEAGASATTKAAAKPRGQGNGNAF